MADFIIFLGEQWMLVGILLVLLTLFMQQESKRGGPVVTHHQLTRMVNQDQAVVLDVREGSDYKEGHIVDSINIPFAKLASRLDELSSSKDRPIIVVDKMNQHSGAAGKQLGEAGFNVSRLAGGITEWKGSNLPLVKD